MTATAWDSLEKPVRRKHVHIGKARKGAPNERTVQREIIKAGGRLGIWCVAVPNSAHLAGDAGQRMRKMAAMKADGLHVGMLDLVCIAKAGRVGMLEVKKEGGILSPAQIQTMKLLSDRGVPNAAVCTLDGALETWRAWEWL